MNLSDKPSLSNEDSVDFSIGSVLFDRFQILAEIASGGQGRVYKAQDLILNNPVALKVLLSNSVTDRDIMRFQHEARLASKMKHQGIATIYDFGIYKNTPFLSMEFVAGLAMQAELLGKKFEAKQLHREEARNCKLRESQTSLKMP